MLHPPRQVPPRPLTLRPAASRRVAGPIARLLAAIAAVAIVSTACTSGSSAGSDIESGGDGSTSSTEESTTTTERPAIIALTPSLGLTPDQCWAEVPEATTTTTSTTEAPSTTAALPTTTVAPTAPETLGETVTTLPRPPTIAVVPCEGTHEGRAFAAFCLLEDLESDTDRLTSGSCAVASDLEWPGDRAVRRAAARICIQRFEENFGESYGESELIAREFTPTEGVWDLGDRRVVCTVDRLEP